MASATDDGPDALVSRAPTRPANACASSLSPSGAMITNSSSIAAAATGSPSTVARQSLSRIVTLRPARLRRSCSAAPISAPARSVVPNPRRASTSFTTRSAGLSTSWLLATTTSFPKAMTLKSLGARQATEAAATAEVANGLPPIDPLRSTSRHSAVPGCTQARTRSRSGSTPWRPRNPPASTMASILASMSRSPRSGR